MRLFYLPLTILLTICFSCNDPIAIPDPTASENWMVGDYKVTSPYCTFSMDEPEQGPQRQPVIMEELLSWNDQGDTDVMLRLTDDSFEIIKDGVSKMRGHAQISNREILLRHRADTLHFTIIYQCEKKLILYSAEKFEFGSAVTIEFDR